MRKLISALFYLVFLYVILQLILLFFNKGHQATYFIEKDGKTYEIYEEFVRDKDDSHYFFQIRVGNETFYFQTYRHFYRAEEIIKQIGYVETDFATCLLPVLAFNQLISDVVCHYNEGVYNYQTIRGIDDSFDAEVELIHPAYSVEQFVDEADNVLDEGFTAVHLDHVLDDHYVFVDNYRGIDNVSKNSSRRITSVAPFNKDVYKTELRIIVGEYVVFADYNRDLDFDKLWRISLVNNVMTTIELPEAIGFDAVFQGVVDDLLYIYNFDNRKQYQVDVDNGKVIEIGNVYLGIKVFKNGKWEVTNVDDASKSSVKFVLEDEVRNKDDYWLVKKILGEIGYVYYVIERDEDYLVYQAPGRRPDYMKYVFTTKEPANIIFLRDYVYYKERLYVRYYHDEYGLKTLVVNQEFLFNESLGYGVYIKR